MDPLDFVTIEVEQLTGEMALEIKLAIRACDIEAYVSGSNLTWAAKGLRVVVPAPALEALRESIDRLVSRGVPQRS